MTTTSPATVLPPLMNLVAVHPMKRSFLIALSLSLAGFIPFAAESADEIAAPLNLVERDWHESRWEFTSPGVDGAGQPVVLTHAFTELATGLNRWDASTGAFVPASAAFGLEAGQAVVRGAQYGLRVRANADDIDGVVDVTLPDGQRLLLQTVGIALTDPDNGRSIFLGEVRESIGILADDHTVIYPSAFSGYEADIRVTSRLDGFASDVLLREAIDRPAVLAHGLDPDKVRLEVWHQVLVNPQPRVEGSPLERLDGRNDSDQLIDFGSMRMALGKAFAFGNEAANVSDTLSVAKEWVRIDGLDFLIESIPFAEAEMQLEALPPRAEARLVPRDRLDRAFASARQGRRSRPVSLATATRTETRPKTFASVARGSARPGSAYVIDYDLLSVTTNMTLKGDTTYYVSSAVNLAGNTILEAGCVVKFTNQPAATVGITIWDTFECNTVPYCPAVFTAKDDNSVGEPIPGSSGSPSGTYALYNLAFAHSSTNTAAIQLHDFRSSYGVSGVHIARRTGTSEIWNAQIQDCQNGIDLARADVTVRNALIREVTYAFLFEGSSVSKNADGEHVTIHDANKIHHLTASSSSCTTDLTNSLATIIAASSSAGLSTNNTYVFTNDPGLYLSVTNGAHYLAAGSAYRDVGTSGLSSRMLSILPLTTTYAPTPLTSNFAADTTLAPTVQRDTDTPDLGYHYYPLDYLWGGLTISNSVTVLLTNGVAVGVFGADATFLDDGAKVVSEGTPANLNRIVTLVTVQEQPTTLTPTNTYLALFNNLSASFTNASEVNARFTEVAVLGADEDYRAVQGSGGKRSVTFAHSVLRNAYLANYTLLTNASSALHLTNSLLERVLMENTQYSGTNVYNVSLSLWNNLFRQGRNRFTYADTSSTWSVYDNLFVLCTTPETLMGANKVPNDYNAWYSTAALSTTGLSNKTLLNIDFVAGPLGPYYYPTSSTNLYSLVNAGSRNATNAGLYHFTTHTNQTKEASSVVDIGMHYVAVDTGQLPSLVPQDADSDGLPDYLEDRNGNGTADTGETNWQDANDFGLNVLITQPKANSSVP